MRDDIVMRTDRLILRKWRDSDREAFAALNADPVVCEFLPGPLSREQSDASVDRIMRQLAEHDFGMWAVEIPGVVEFAGFTGLSIQKFEAHFTPCVEVGWRLAAAHWGRGYATEAARAAIDFGFSELELPEIVSYTVPENVRSRRVMEKLGMKRDENGDFDHPFLTPGHRLERHVLYRLSKADFVTQ